MILITNRTSGKPQSVILDGKEFLKVPAVLLVEGVHAGSGGALYYSEAMLIRTASQWNKIPVCINHPTNYCDDPVSVNSDPSAIVGYVSDAAFSNGKLNANLYLDRARLAMLDDSLLARIMAGGIVELSTGLFITDAKPGGVWHGEVFDAELQSYLADHLAILPYSEGACSVADGCGCNTITNGGGRAFSALSQIK